MKIPENKCYLLSIADIVPNSNIQSDVPMTDY